MQTKLFTIDPMAATSYGMYNAVKGEEGTFLDFLLNYDSKKANESDNSWLEELVTSDNLSQINSIEVLQELNLSEVASSSVLNQFNLSGTSTMDYLSTKNYFDTQAEGYKQILINEMEKRGIEVPKEYEGADIYSSLLNL